MIYDTVRQICMKCIEMQYFILRLYTIIYVACMIHYVLRTMYDISYIYFVAHIIIYLQ